MKKAAARPLTLLAAVLLLGTAGSAAAQSIYKCPKGNSVEYTDHPCPGHAGELIHQASDQEVIDQYLDLGQLDLARRYADARHLDPLYQQRLAAYQQRLQDKAARQAEQAQADRQRAEAAEKQALADEQQAHRDQLQAENDLLRQQNDQYRNQVQQPVYGYASGYVPNYWGGSVPPYRRPGHGGDHDHDHDHGHAPSQPIFHPCTQLAGGRVQC